MSTTHRVIKNTGILYAKMGITLFISLYTTRLILNSLGATDFGIFTIVGGAIAMLGFLNAAMAGATQRFMSHAEGEGNKDKQQRIFNVSVVLHFLIALAVGIALLVAGIFFFHGILHIPADRMPAARMVYHFMIISTMLTVMTVPYDAVLNAHENMLYYALVGIIESVLKLCAAWVVVYTLADKLVVYGALMAGISLTVMVIMRIYCHRHYAECEWGPRKYWDKGLMKEMGEFAGWNFLRSASSIINNYGMGIILNLFFGALLNAAQGIANQLNGQLQAFSGSMMKAIAPIIVKSEGAGDRKMMVQTAIWGCKSTFFINTFLMLPFFIAAPQILTLWLKEVPDYTVVFSRLLIINTLLECFLTPLVQMTTAQGNIGRLSAIISIHKCIYLPIIILAFHLGWPPYSMYLAMAFKTAMTIGIVLFFAKRNCGITYQSFIMPVMLRCLMSLLIAYTVLTYSYAQGLPPVTGIFILFAESFIVVSLVTYIVALTPHEKHCTVTYLKALLSKRRTR